MKTTIKIIGSALLIAMLFMNVTVFTIENDKNISVKPKLALTIDNALAKEGESCAKTGQLHLDGSYAINGGPFCHNAEGEICGWKETCVTASFGGAPDCQDITCP